MMKELKVNATEEFMKLCDLQTKMQDGGKGIGLYFCFRSNVDSEGDLLGFDLELNQRPAGEYEMKYLIKEDAVRMNLMEELTMEILQKNHPELEAAGQDIAELEWEILTTEEKNEINKKIYCNGKEFYYYILRDICEKLKKVIEKNNIDNGYITRDDDGKCYYIERNAFKIFFNDSVIGQCNY